MPSISLAVSGQTSDAYEVGPGARVTASGSGYVEWTSGTLTDVRNGAASWSTWPKGATTGYADTLRRVCIRGVATGALTVTWDEGERDEGPDDAYWQEQVPAWSIDSSGNVQGLVGPDGNKTLLPARLQAENAVRTIDGFSATGAWSSSSTGVPSLSVSTIAQVGNALTITTDGTTNNHDIVRTFACRLDQGQAIAFSFKAVTNQNLLNVAVSLGDSTFTKTATLLDDAVPGTGGGSRPDYIASEWKTLIVSGQQVAGYSGGGVFADLKDVRAIRFRFRAGSAVVIAPQIAQLRYIQDGNGLRVIWQFDDAYLRQYTHVAPILGEYGYKGSIAVPPADLGTTVAAYNNVELMSEEQALALYGRGWELLGHHGTSMSGLSESQQQAHLDTFLAWCAANGVTRGRSHWVYTGGWFDSSSSALVNRQFLTARRVTGSAPPYAFNVRSVFEQSQVGSFYVGQAYALATAKAKLDTLATMGNGVAVFTFHNIVDSYTAVPEDWLTADFQELVRYAYDLGFVGSTFDAEFGSLYE